MVVGDNVSSSVIDETAACATGTAVRHLLAFLGLRHIEEAEKVFHGSEGRLTPFFHFSLHVNVDHGWPQSFVKAHKIILYLSQ